MDKTGAAAYVVSQAAAAVIEALGMHAENQQRQACGCSMAYDQSAFVEVIAARGLDPKAVRRVLQEPERG